MQSIGAEAALVSFKGSSVAYHLLCHKNACNIIMQMPCVYIFCAADCALMAITQESITIMSMHLSLTSFLMLDDLSRIVHIREFSSVYFSANLVIGINYAYDMHHIM